jgi:hypothetical protein
VAVNALFLAGVFVVAAILDLGIMAWYRRALKRNGCFILVRGSKVQCGWVFQCPFPATGIGLLLAAPFYFPILTFIGWTQLSGVLWSQPSNPKQEEHNFDRRTEHND